MRIVWLRTGFNPAEIKGVYIVGAGAGGLYGVYGMAGACLPNQCSVSFLFYNLLQMLHM